MPDMTKEDACQEYPIFSNAAVYDILDSEFEKNGKPYIKCRVTKADRAAKPEEIVRQLWLLKLQHCYGYPVSRIAVEHPVNFGREIKRADIVVFDADHPTTPYIIIETKKVNEKDGKEQLKSYCHATGAPIGVWSNGSQVAIFHRKDPNYFGKLPDLPHATGSLADLLNEPMTLEDLAAKEAAAENRKSLKQIILDMQDEVLANAGVDVFEEVFKLVFSKLYDELSCHQGKYKHLRFRQNDTDAKVKAAIGALFDEARRKWPGVFPADDKIKLNAAHLAICASYLENYKLFNSNLDVVDEAFEYLVNQSSKGEKGQYFTPRYVIDMCVKMLNPKETETLIDTAAGSAGFTVHGIFHVWRAIMDDLKRPQNHLFTAEKKPIRCVEYVQDKVFAIDFDEKAVRVSRCLNLIAGDGQTNVLHLNTLDWPRWEETVKGDDWQDTYSAGWVNLRKQRPKNAKDYREFRFDVLMANPPFAGDIKQGDIIHRYELGRKANGKYETKVGRDLLFIERNLDFLKPGGRMAVVLPQGRFNNSSDKRVREFVAERCRILAVVGLHGNTFKPHTGTKTSVLFVQKWNDDPKAGPLCPKVDDYNIFFATMQKTGKDSSGEKIIAGRDSHGHDYVDHDLFNHNGETQDGIAEAFAEFAKKEKLSFF